MNKSEIINEIYSADLIKRATLVAFYLINRANKERTCFGDSLSSDVSGAMALGINVCWLNRNKKKNSSGCTADIECYSLLELINHLK